MECWKCPLPQGANHETQALLWVPLTGARQLHRFRGGVDARQLSNAETFAVAPAELTCTDALATNFEPAVKPVLSASHGYRAKALEHRILDGIQAAS